MKVHLAMPIRLSCPCGRQRNIGDDGSCKVIRCPECSGAIRVSVVKQASGQKRQPTRHESNATLQREVRPKKPKNKPVDYLREADPYDDLSCRAHHAER